MNKFTKMFINKGNQIKQLKQKRDSIEVELNEMLNDPELINEEKFKEAKEKITQEIASLKNVKFKVENGSMNIKSDIIFWLITAIPAIIIQVLLSFNIWVILICGVFTPTLLYGSSIIKTKKIMKKYSLEELNDKIDLKSAELGDLEETYEETKRTILNKQERVKIIEGIILELVAEITNSSLTLSGLSQTMNAEIVDYQVSDCITPKQRVLAIKGKGEEIV